ncbi:ClpX C4-type zinc finger protein [Clostridium sp. ZBS18]|uniref:ClpX C4-type zinc finger protein n=1 Tax=Clostridium sp. ZBS18 TaxID=2949967 RepID=UPI0020795F2E|nr:ClpX C4-type zinc finger protein [Clostridium sp. ZBS18]
MHKCDFCGKDQTEVKKMITSHGVDICEGCVLLCMEILIEKTSDDFKRIEFEKKEK